VSGGGVDSSCSINDSGVLAKRDVFVIEFKIIIVSSFFCNYVVAAVGRAVRATATRHERNFATVF